MENENEYLQEEIKSKINADNIVCGAGSDELLQMLAKAYLGDDTPGDASKLHFPGFGEEAAKLLVRERAVAALGVDTASIDHGQSRNFLTHQVAGEKNVLGLENLTGLEALPEQGALLIALPMKIGGGSGGPARVIALVPRDAE